MDILIIILFVGLYFLPSLAAIGHRNGISIFILNLLLGWSVIEWVGALVWAFSNDKKNEVILREKTSVSDELIKLKDLHSKGVLTDEEYENQKHKILNNS